MAARVQSQTPLLEHPLPDGPVRIGDAALRVGLPCHVLRYWESEFAIPVHRARSGQRWYPRESLVLFGVIKWLLHVELYTIAGAKRQLRLMAEREKEAG